VSGTAQAGVDRSVSSYVDQTAHIGARSSKTRTGCARVDQRHRLLLEQDRDQAADLRVSATHLLDRVLAVLRADQPYEVRDTDGTPLIAQQARAMIVERYSVAPVVRQLERLFRPFGESPWWLTARLYS
jgi:hypothetical protein